MRKSFFNALILLLAMALVAPAMSGCTSIASYLLYQWMDDQFNNDDTPDEDPVVTKIMMDRSEVYTGDTVILEVEAEDDVDKASELDYLWVVSGGTLVNATNRITAWQVPNTSGDVTISVLVTDSDDNQGSATVKVTVLQ
jgi:hypothetical protein